MRRLILGHVRRSTALVVVPIAAVVLGIVFFTDVDRWRYEWDWGLLHLGVAFYVLGPVLAAAASLDAVRSRRVMQELATGRRASLRGAWPSFVVLAVASLCVWFVWLTVAVIVLLTSQAVGHVRWLGLVSQVLAIFGFSALGALVGTLLPRWWVPPALGVALYGALVAWFGAVTLLPMAPATYIAAVQTPSANLTLLSVFYLGLVALLLPTNWHPQRDARLRYGAAAVTSVAAVAAVLVGHPSTVSQEDVTACTVVRSDLEVCLSEVYASGLRHAADVVDETLAPLDALGVAVPSPVRLQSGFPTVQPPGEGLTVAVHAGMIRQQWRADPRYDSDDLQSRVIGAVATGSCPSWTSDLGPSWAEIAAAQILSDWLRVELQQDVELYWPEPWYALDTSHRMSALPDLFEATVRCDSVQLAEILHPLGIAEQ